MSNEIKVGDKVRVREDVPKMYSAYKHRGVVKDVDRDCALVESEDRLATDGLRLWRIIIPTKYLVKVEEENKAPKFKVGDRVEELVSRKSGRVLGIEGDFVVVGIPYDKEKYYWHIDSVELVEPTEQPEAEKSFEDQLRDVLNGVEHQDYGHPIHTAMINLDINDWDSYAADLAKEVALKVANKYNDPNEVAEYAVSVAKAVVEGLKKK